MSERRLKVLRISGEVLVGWFQRGMPAAALSANPLPADARVIEARYDNWTGELDLVIESETFAPLQPLCVPMVLEPPQFTRPAPPDLGLC